MSDLKYMFTLATCFTSRWVAETPAGNRVDLEYRGLPGHEKEVATNPELIDADGTLGRAHNLQREAEKDAEYLDALRKAFEKHSPSARPWLGIEGHIVSGLDWALLRADGVFEFDGQLVISDGPRDDRHGKGVLVNVRTSGTVDFCRGTERPKSVADAKRIVKNVKEGSVFGIALAMKFEAPGESEPWASRKYRRKQGQLKYIHLSRGQFIAKGKLTRFDADTPRIDLDVYEVSVVRPNGGS